MRGLRVQPECFLTHEMPCSGTGDSLAFERLPASRGVAVLEDRAGRALLIASTADVRAFARRRLEPADAAESVVSRRVDYRSITGCVRAGTCGSVFESEAMYLALARERMAGTYRAVTRRWTGWFVTIDADAVHPRWGKGSTGMLGEHVGASGEGGAGLARLGPLPDKHAAGRVIDVLDDAFDLCRYHHLLVQSPNAHACAYKEMGRCPAPCDGSEPLDSYRRRVREAVEMVHGGVSAWRAEREREMERCAVELRFEVAAAIKRRFEATAELAKASYAWMGGLDHAAWIACVKGERDGWARVMVCAGGAVVAAIDVKGGAGRDAIGCVSESVLRLASARRMSGSWDQSRGSADALGLVSWWLYHGGDGSGRSGRGRAASPAKRISFLRITERIGVEEVSAWLARGMERLMRARSGGEDESDRDELIEAEASDRREEA